MQTFSWFEFMLGLFSFLLLRPVIVSVLRSARRGRRRFRRNRNRIDYERFEQAERKRMMEKPDQFGLTIFQGSASAVSREYEKAMNKRTVWDPEPEVEFFASPSFIDENGNVGCDGITMVVRYVFRHDRSASPA